MGIEDADCFPQVAGAQLVIGMEQNHVGSTRQLDASVPVAGLTKPLLGSHESEARVFVRTANTDCLVNRGVVGHNQFEVSEVLCQGAIYRGGQKPRRVI
jgi:hypothetical protein